MMKFGLRVAKKRKMHILNIIQGKDFVKLLSGWSLIQEGSSSIPSEGEKNFHSRS